MRVTVITAVLNAREGLIKTRDSVLAQQGVDVQHVVIDGGSTDGAVSLLRDWEQRDGVSFLSESDSGVYEAFNKGLRLASGEIIGFLNAGDVFSDETVLSDVASALASPDIDLVYGDVDITHPNSIDRVVRRYRARGFLPSQLLRGFMPPHPSIYAKRETFDLVGDFSEMFKIAGDFEWAIRAFLGCQIESRYLERTFVRMPAGGISNNGLTSVVRNTKEMHAALQLHDLPASWLDLIMRVPRKWVQA